MRPPATLSGSPWASPSGCGSCSTSSCFRKIPRGIGLGSILGLSSLPSRWLSPSSCSDARPRIAQVLRLDEAAGRRLDDGLRAVRGAKAGARVVDVKIDRAVGKADDLINFRRRYAALH